MTHLERLGRDLGARYSTATRHAYLLHARLFMAAAGEHDSYSRDQVLSYVDRLVKAGWANNSIHSAIVGIQALCRMLGCDWPLKGQRLHLPRQSDDEGTGPVLTPDEVEALIRGVKDGSAGYNNRAVVALSTLYGFRVSEISRILAAGLHDSHIAVETSKTRRKREHEIPGVVWPLLEGAQMRVTTGTMHKIFGTLMRAYVRAPRKQEGWHAVRRALATGLAANEVQDRMMVRFFGWARTGSAGVLIADRYTRLTYQQVDEAVMQRHPFLRMWVT